MGNGFKGAGLRHALHGPSLRSDHEQKTRSAGEEYVRASGASVLCTADP
jgi:hypothetical protein